MHFRVETKISQLKVLKRCRTFTQYFHLLITHLFNYSLWELPLGYDDVDDVRDEFVFHDSVGGSGRGQ